MSRKLILFGAGGNGIEACKFYGKDNVAFFCDNDKSKINTLIEGIKVLSFEEMMKVYDDNKYVIMVTPNDYTFLAGLLELEGKTEYVIYKKDNKFNVLKFQKDDEERFIEQNKLIDYYAEKCRDYDLIKDGMMLKKDAIEVIKKHKEGATLLHYGIGAEGNFYGNLETLLEYADYCDFDRIYAPNVSHNALKPTKTTETMFDTAAIVSGKYYKDMIHKWKPYVPVFSVGPYIQYATGIYSDIDVKMQKEKNGKTLTVFLPHSIENISRKYSKKDFVDDVIKSYKSKFETIYLCVYWADLHEECCEYAIDKGLKIITAGYRFDKLFNKRLKTILDLSDAVAGGDLGTHYMYALTLGIPVSKIDISDNTSIYDIEYGDDLKKKVQFDSKYLEYEKTFYKVFGFDFECSEIQKDWCRPYSGIGIKRSKEYIRGIFDISKDILVECDGELSEYPLAVRSVYKKYKEECNYEKIDILVSATGSYVYYK